MTDATAAAVNGAIRAVHGAVWIALIGMAVGGISWAVGLAGKVENQQEQIAALQANVSRAARCMDFIEIMQRDVARLEPGRSRYGRSWTSSAVNERITGRSSAARWH